MESYQSRILIDAVPTCPTFNRNRTKNKRKYNDILSAVLDEFTVDDYKSFLFLLMDELGGLDQFLSLASKDKAFLKSRIQEMRLKEGIVVELLGTMQRYQDLKYFDTCKHVFLSKQQEFDEISEIWKVLYALCEEITDNDLESMMYHIPDNFKNQVSSAEEWFCCALKYGIITRTNLSRLKDIFEKDQKCLNIIDDFNGDEIKCYYIRTPTVHSPCGLAVIFNFEIFTKSTLTKRDGSEVDVASFENLWETFGFKTHIFRNLTSFEVMKVLEDFSMKDHSKYDAFVCCVLSHGESNVFYASDGIQISITKLISTISNNCVSLNEKPKLFFIQACQGTIIYQGVGKPQYDLNDEQESSALNLPLQKCNLVALDVNAVVSTIDKCVSFRDPLRGGLFVQTFCSVMLEYGHTNSLLDVITCVTAKASKVSIDLGPGMPGSAQQIVPFSSTLRKKLILKKKVV